MKKMLTLFIVIIFLLVGCGEQMDNPSVPEETPDVVETPEQDEKDKEGEVVTYEIINITQVTTPTHFYGPQFFQHYERPTPDEAAVEVRHDKTFHQVVVEVENTGNVPLFFQAGGFDWYNEDQWVGWISLASYTLIVEPGERINLYGTGLHSVSHSPEEEDFIPSHTPWFIPLNAPLEVALGEYEISNISLEDDGTVMTIQGEVDNTGEIDGRGVGIVIILFDAYDLPLGQFFTSADLPAGESTSFERITSLESFWYGGDIFLGILGFFIEDVARIKAIAYHSPWEWQWHPLMEN